MTAWRYEISLHVKRNFISPRGHVISSIYYINTNEIPGELSRENMISSHVKITRLLWLHDTSRLRSNKMLKLNGLAFHWCLYNK